MIRRLATFGSAVSLAWLEEGGVDRTIVGGVLWCLILTNVVVLHQVFSEPALSGLVVDLGVIGETNVFAILSWMVLFYILRPVRVFRRAREESIQQVEELVSDETEARLE